MGYRSLAVLISRYPRFIILSWVFVIGMSAVWAWKLPGIVQDHGLNLNQGDAHAVELILEEEFHVPADPVILLFEKKTGTTPAEFRDWIKDRLQQVHTLSSVTSIISPLESRDSLMLRGMRRMLCWRLMFRLTRWVLRLNSCVPCLQQTVRERSE